MTIQEFSDRKSQYPNRRKLKIITQTADEIIADIEYADTPSQDGTPINATILNQIAKAAVDAGQKADGAQTTADQAKDTADKAWNHVINEWGTKVEVAGDPVPVFDADLKVDVSNYETDKINLNARLTNLEAKPAVVKVNYDELTDTILI